MSTVFVNAKVSDEERRRQLYRGQLFAYSPTEHSLELCKLADTLAREAFAPYDPRTAQYALAVEKYVEILALLKPKFIHHPRSKELIREIFAELGCDVEKTYFDVPRLRTMTHGDYLTAGLPHAFHPHRRTPVSAPPPHPNRGVPLLDLPSAKTTAVHPHYRSPPRRNTPPAAHPF